MQLANEDSLLQQRLQEQRQQHLQALQAEHSQKEQEGNDQVFMCMLITADYSCHVAHGCFAMYALTVTVKMTSHKRSA